MSIPLEDNVSDILGKAQRGLGISDNQLAERSGVSVEKIRKLRDGDLIRIEIDTHHLTGTLNFIGTPEREVTPAEGANILASRGLRDIVAQVRAAKGASGPCVEYVTGVARELARLSIDDPAVTSLCQELERGRE